ncbi:hypothetical protein HOLleu_09014 [Holothuria leucospilota]|uniref:Uncharacterized protein n=1 Tax=Holothuria leucospilota TaxID=206669 RepID=A0A9Q1CI87_HOLLE|nr:hypothetical protein HOLleu_09014 [Holothuria leucospilota]
MLISWSSLASSPIAMVVVPFPDLQPDYGIPCHMIYGNEFTELFQETSKDLSLSKCF